MNGYCSIAGDWQPASGGRQTRIIDPTSGQLNTDVADGSVEDGPAAVGAAERVRPARAATQTFAIAADWPWTRAPKEWPAT